MSARKSQYQTGYEEGRKEGFVEGLQKGREEILDFLEKAYIEAPDRPDRDSAKAEAILEMARDAQQHIQARMKGQSR